MNVGTRTYKNWRIIAPEGKFIVQNLISVRTVFEQAAIGDSPHIAIDMSGVERLDSSAISLLMNFRSRIEQNGGALALFGLCDDIREVFSIVGIEKVFKIYETRAEFEDGCVL